VVEDNRADVYLIREAIEVAHLRADLQVVTDGEAAMQVIDRLDADDTLPRPQLMVLDINLPKRSGADVLAHLRRSRRCSQIWVLVVSTSDSLQDRHRMLRLGADRYFRKPSEYDDFLLLGDEIRDLLSRA
jgi:DNA-binding response OmpR family regulator